MIYCRCATIIIFGEKMDENNKIDILEYHLDRIQNLIERADTKASILLAFLGVVITITISHGGFFPFLSSIFLQRSNRHPLLMIIMVSLFFLSLFASFVFVIMTLQARLRPGRAYSTTSNFFFGKIARFNKFEDFQDTIEVSVSQADKHLIRDIFINSKICTKKYKYYNCALIFLMICVVSLLINTFSILFSF